MSTKVYACGSINELPKRYINHKAFVKTKEEREEVKVMKRNTNTSKKPQTLLRWQF